MQKYYFKSEIKDIDNGDIFVSDNGNGYVQNGELHITENNYHFVYKLDENVEGWYMRNSQTGEDIFLGDGASPTAEYESIDVKNQACWEEIQLITEDNPEETPEEQAQDVEVALTIEESKTEVATEEVDEIANVEPTEAVIETPEEGKISE